MHRPDRITLGHARGAPPSPALRLFMDHCTPRRYDLGVKPRRVTDVGAGFETRPYNPWIPARAGMTKGLGTPRRDVSM